jgi:8-amino-7-oxononanoate synthase
MAEGLDAALDVIYDEPELRTRLLELSVRFREALIERGLRVAPGVSQIIPVIIGGSEQAVNVAEILQVQGYDVRAIRPPSVPTGSSRLRLSVNVHLDKGMIADFSLALSEALEQYTGMAA